MQAPRGNHEFPVTPPGGESEVFRDESEMPGDFADLAAEELPTRAPHLVQKEDADRESDPDGVLKPLID